MQLFSQNSQRPLLTVLLSAAVLSCLTSCSGGKKVSLIPLKEQQLSSVAVTYPSSGAKSFMEIRPASGSTSNRGFVTALRSCGHNEKDSLRGTTRQIFVGLEQVRITHQEAADFPPRTLWHVEADAESEGLPIQVSTYTLKEDRCFVDFVLWVVAPQGKNISSETEQELADMRTQFHDLVGETLSQL